MTLPALLFVGCVVVPSTVWIALAFHYRVRWWWLRWLISAVPLVAVGASLRWLPLLPGAMAIWLAFLMAAAVCWFALRPRSERDWAIGMEVLPRAQRSGDALCVRNFRDFRYTASGDPVPRYAERTFDLGRLQSLDFFLSHWSGPVMAHTLVSFGFDDGQYLCVSVEARRRRWQRYSPFWGLFRSYELMFVLGDERDIVQLRTSVRRERVYMYRVRLSREHIQRLLVDYVNRVEALAEGPRWYNSVTSNCTTNLFYQGHVQVPWWSRPEVLLNGFCARSLFKLGFLDDTLPFDELQSRCAIRERALAVGDAGDFSQQIRVQQPLPAPR